MKIGNEFKERQQYLLHQLGDKSIAILFAAKVAQRNGENDYPYRQNSDFYYLTGFNEPSAIAVFVPGRPEGEYLLFCMDRDPEQEIWYGERVGQERAITEYGADQAFSISQAEEMMHTLIYGRERIFFNSGVHPGFDARIMRWAKQLESKSRSGINVPTAFINIGTIVHEMRLVKDDSEQQLLKTAAEITAEAQLEVMQQCKPGMYENELEAILQCRFLRGGGSSSAFQSIVASGKHSCVLHYVENRCQIKDGDLVLIDAGVEYKNYAADISRTFPANGKFSVEQKAVYQAVLDVQKAVIAIIRPGIPWVELHRLSEHLITEKLVSLGILQGEVQELLRQGAFKRFYMHHIGHWLGLDGHDVGSYKVGEKWRILEEGMVLTVEPGIYIQEGSAEVDPKWWNIGVRIEDDILVTENGCEVLTTGVPKEIAEIEAVMAGQE